MASGSLAASCCALCCALPQKSGMGFQRASKWGLIVCTSDDSIFLPAETAFRATEDAVPEPGDTEVRGTCL